MNNKNITIRKTKKYDGSVDISGDYNNYAVNKDLNLFHPTYNFAQELVQKLTEK